MEYQGTSPAVYLFTVGDINFGTNSEKVDVVAQFWKLVPTYGESYTLQQVNTCSVSMVRGV